MYKIFWTMNFRLGFVSQVTFEMARICHSVDNLRLYFPHGIVKQLSYIYSPALDTFSLKISTPRNCNMYKCRAVDNVLINKMISLVSFPTRRLFQRFFASRN